MDLNHVAAFARVVHDGSFTAAAKALGVPKSSVSRSVAQLEQELGARLLHRTTRKIHLTEAGTSFYERVARALSDIEAATNEAADAQTEPRGIVRMTAAVDIGVWSLAPILARFTKEHPTIHVDVSLSNRTVDLAAEGFDLAVRVGPIRDQSLVARKVGTIDGGLFASRRYVERAGVPADVADLAKHDCIAFGPAGNAWRLATRDGRNEAVTIHGTLGTDDMSFVKKAVLAGAGIGLMPDFLGDKEAEAGKVVRILPEWRLTGSDLFVVYPSAQFLPRRVAALRDHLVAELTTLLNRCSEHKRSGSRSRSS